MDIEFLLRIVVWFGGSATIAAIVAALVDVLKRFGVVKDGDAGRWAARFNLLFLAVFSVWFFLNPAFDFASVDESLKAALAVIQVVLGLVLQLATSQRVHLNGVFAGVWPFKSFDFTLDDM